MEIRISAKAMRNRQRLLDAIADRQSLRVSQRVDKRIQDLIADIPNFPLKWPAVRSSKLGDIHKITIDELTLVFYRMKVDFIEVIDIVDARSDYQI